MEGRRILRLEKHQGAVIGERFHNPLVAVTAPGHKIAPPLVGNFMRRCLLEEQPHFWIRLETFPLRRGQKSVTGEKDQARPPLAGSSRKLRQGKLAVREWTEALLIELHRLCGRIANGLRVMSGGRGSGWQCGRKGGGVLSTTLRSIPVQRACPDAISGKNQPGVAGLGLSRQLRFSDRAGAGTFPTGSKNAAVPRADIAA